MSFARHSAIWRTSSFRQAMLSSAVIWIATALVASAMHYFTLHALVTEVTGDIDQRIKLRTAGLERLRPGETPTQWLYNQLAHKVATLSDCAMLIAPDGEIELSNTDISAHPEFRYGDYFIAEYTGYRWRPDTDSGPNACLVRDIALSDGGKLIYGGPFDSYFAIIKRIDALLFWGLAVTGGLSFCIGFALSWRAVVGLQKINAVCAAVAGGDLQQRIALRHNNDDLDDLAGAINHMLDRINQLMDGIRQVSDSIAHDLKTPLSHIRGRLERLLATPTRSDEAIQSVIEEADRLLNAFNALLRISQLDQGTIRQAFEYFDFRDVTAVISEMYELVFAEKSISFAMNITERSCPVYGDKNLWLQAVTNILDNAYKYCSENGQVRVALRAEENCVRLIIHDSGPGIPESEQLNVFKRFYRLEKHRGETGTGLGLSLVSAVCNIHNATITLNNDSGLVVTIDIPWRTPS